MTHTFEAAEWERADWAASFQRLFHKSKWPVNRPRHGHGRSYWLSMVIFIGHQIGTTVIFMALFSLAWSLGLGCAWLNSIHPFSESIFELASKVELALVYGDTALCACFWIEGAWLFLKETRP